MMKPIGAFLTTVALLTGAALAEDKVIYKKGYVDGPYGQIHYHSARPSDGDGDKTPLVLFHQNPKSAEEYRPLLEVVGQNRLAIAFDTPGYGESDRPDSPPDMAGIASAMADALDALGYGKDGSGSVDVFGFHTGVFIASELAITRPDLVRRVVMSGIAYYGPEARAERLADLPTDKSLPEDGTFIMNRWYLIVINRAEGVSLERASKVFLEDIHSLDKSWYAYNAVWTYAPEERFPLIEQPILVLQPHEMLLDHSRKAKKEAMPNADMIELPNITDDVFDTGSEEIGSALVTWLDQSR
ncbi:MAG: alpha/beta fold hydrolase [Alphaproteobacteria bacterium]|nr:alpha/beta fold hydrolase [Alphaproteobacteria bacterium]